MTTDDNHQTPKEANPPPTRPERGIAATIPNAIDTTGLPMFTLDPQTVIEQYRARGYIITLCWMLDPSDGRADAAMVLFPERRFDDAGHWAITRRGIMQFCDEHNRPTPYAFQQAAEALPVLGYDVIKAEIIRLVATVMDYVDDLVQAPAAPLRVKLLLSGDPMWDVTLHAHGSPNKVIRETTI